MLDELRRDMQQRLNDVLEEADKLRHALLALGPHDHATSSTAPGRPSATSSRPPRSPARRAPRASASTGSATTTGPATTTKPRSGDVAAVRTRTAPGDTKRAVLAALGSGTAMTASDVAKSTGLGRASVSTTLSKLAKSGEVTKAARGYELAG